MFRICTFTCWGNERWPGCRVREQKLQIPSPKIRLRAIGKEWGSETARGNGQEYGDACEQSSENAQESGWAEPEQARKKERSRVPANEQEQAQRKQELEPWNERELSEQKAGQSLAAEPLELEDPGRD